MKTLQDYIQTHKKEYKTKSYEEMLPFVREFEKFLLNNLTSAEAVCTLSAVWYELRKSEKEIIKLLENYYKKHRFQLSYEDIARLSTNIAYFYYEEGEIDKALAWVEMAIAVDSPFSKSYYGKAFLYFLKWEQNRERAVEFFREASMELKKALKLKPCYEHEYSYAVSLYMSEQFLEAKQSFEILLEKHPNRMRLLLCLAFVYFALGNTEKSLKYLKQVKIDEDEHYHHDPTDCIAEWDVANLYFLMGNYAEYLSIAENHDIRLFKDTEEYFYSLWHLEKIPEYEQNLKDNITQIEEIINERLDDEDFEEQEREEYIAKDREDIEKLKSLDKKIKNGYKPTPKLYIYPIYQCFMVGCLLHG